MEHKAPDFDRYKPLDVSRYKRPSTTSTAPEVHYDACPTFIRRPTRRWCEDWRSSPKACETLRLLPQDGESLHAVLGGSHTLWQLVPALLERSGAERFDELYLATLSYSYEVADDLISLMDAGKIGTFGLYFSAWTADIPSGRKLYDYLVPQLHERGHKVLAMNVHAKLILARMSNGDHYTCEASVNLKACRGIEQMVLTHDRGLYDFHRAWMQDVERYATNKGRHGEPKTYKTSFPKTT